jgi:hypothetical protein
MLTLPQSIAADLLVIPILKPRHHPHLIAIDNTHLREHYCAIHFRTVNALGFSPVVGRFSTGT